MEDGTVVVDIACRRESTPANHQQASHSPFQPGGDPATFPRDHAEFLRYAGDSEGDARKVPAEPPPAPYAAQVR